jgi:protein-tyrosine kinase
MSRVDEAMRRAAAAPKLAAANSPLAERYLERMTRSGLDHYPREDRRLGGSTAVDEPGNREPVSSNRESVPSNRESVPSNRESVPSNREPAPENREPVNRLAVSTGRRSDVMVMPRFSEAYRDKLVIDPSASIASIEQYRRLAATLHHLQAEQGLGRLMVSSALPREGKTLTVVNLALTLSESYGRRVLLIDADLRHPSVHEVFGIRGRHGLCDALRSERAQFHFSRVSENLWVLPAGSPDADHMTALASRQIEQFLDEVASQFDWILLDTPPFGVMADAGLLVRLTRAVIIVIAAGSTPYARVEKAVNEFGREHIVGTVLNRVEGASARLSAYYPDGDVLDEPPLPDSVTGLKETPVRKQKVELLRP